MSWLVWVLAGAVVLGAAYWLLIAALCRGSLGRVNRPAFDLSGVPWAETHREEDWTQDTPDGLRLMAWYFPAPLPTSRWAVLVHGYRDRAESSFPWARLFHEAGYHVLSVDCRAHGRSQGLVTGMGWPDRRDVIGWIRQIEQKDPDAVVALYGLSMGAATILMASGEPDFPSSVRCCVADCGFTSVHDIFAYRFRRKTGLPPWLVLGAAGLFCRLVYGLDFRRASAVRQLRTADCPVFLIHGEEDTYVPYRMMRELADAAPAGREQLSVPGARHAESFLLDPGYWDRVIGFVNRQMPEAAEQPEE